MDSSRPGSEPISPQNHGRKKSFFPLIQGIPEVDIVKKKSKRKPHHLSSPGPNNDSDSQKDEKEEKIILSMKKQATTTSSHKHYKGSFRASQPKEILNVINIDPITNLNAFKYHSMRVFAKFRPDNIIEKEYKEKSIADSCVIFLNGTTLQVNKNQSETSEFMLDGICKEEYNQDTSYSIVAKSLVKEFCKGFNCTLMTYGQSSSGKTYTAVGDNLNDSKGILPRSIDDLFNHINTEGEAQFEVIFSALEICRETCFDLSSPTSGEIVKVIDDKKKGILFENLTETYIQSKEEIYDLLENIMNRISVSENKGKSHYIYMIKLTQKYQDEAIKKSTLTVVDLAASKRTDSVEDQQNINLSLICLANVINTLSNSQTEFVPYKDSKLTKILKESFGGNTKMNLIICASTNSVNVDDTLLSLNFAKRARMVKNKVKMNIKRNPDVLEEMIATLNNKLKVANAEIKKFQTNFTGSASLRNSVMGSPIKIRQQDSIASRVTPVQRNGSVTNSPLKLTKKPFSVAVDAIAAAKSKSSFFEPMNVQEVKTPNREDNGEKLFSEDKSGYGSNSENMFYNSNSKWTKNETLKEKLETVQAENRLIEEKLKKFEEQVKTEVVLNQIGETISNSVKQFESFSQLLNQKKQNLTYTENKQLKEKLASIETGQWHNSFNKILVDDNFNLSVENVPMKAQFKKFLDLIKDDESKIAQSYRSIYQNLKFFSNDILHTFLKKNEEDVKTEDTIIIEKSKFVNLKNSLMKSSTLLVYYEKMMHDLFDKLTVDISNQTSKVETFILNEKQMKIYEETLNSFNANFLSCTDMMSQLKSFVQSKEELSTVNTAKLETPANKKPRFFANASKPGSKIEGGQIVSKFNSEAEIKTQTGTSEGQKTEDLCSKVDQAELRMLRKESIISKSQISNLLKEISLLRESKSQIEQNFIELQEQSKVNFKAEFDSLEKAFRVQKEIYNDEIKYLRQVIQQLSVAYDDILLNIKKDSSGKEILSNYFKEKSEKIITGDFKERPLSTLTGSIVSEGFASKKLDYIYIDMIKSRKEVDIHFGSGINQVVPSKCPLYKNLKFAPEGDNCNEVYTPEVTEG